MGTFVSILLGTLIRGWIITIEDGAFILGLLMIAMALIGWISSHQIPTAPPVNKVNNIIKSFQESVKFSFGLSRQNCLLLYPLHFMVLALRCYFLTQVPNFTVTF